MKLDNKSADNYIRDIVDHCKHTLTVKAKEYVRNDDRMHNFNKASLKKNISREQAIDGMRLKHEISIDDIREDVSKGNLPSKELLLEKFGDIINYYILEYMSIRQKITNDKRDE